MSALVTRTLSSDHLTPAAAYAALRAQSPGRSSFLLESVIGGERWGRWSILGYRARREAIYPALGDAIAQLGEAAVELAAEVRGGASMAERFSQAMVGYVAYDAVNTPHKLKPFEGESDAARMMRDSTVVVFDNQKQTLTIAGRSKNAVDRCEWEMSHGAALAPLPPIDPAAAPRFVDETLGDEAYGAKVARAKEYILAGDAFQIVLARSFIVPQREADPFDVYRALRVLSPSPYMFFLDFAESPMAGRVCIAGASPETMVRVADGKMTLRPIAGTRRRGATEAEDAALAAELEADAKERAEHVMLVDLARNDVGRVCEPGSVRVTQQMKVERFSHVMHLVSEVEGTLRAGETASSSLAAGFPAGTLTGAPKVRATQIIRELEPRARGIYGGAVGYVLDGGEFDLAIAIRTVVCRDGQFEVTAGAGIVEASDPQAEADETRSKARAALAAIRAAQDAAELREEAAARRSARDAAEAEARGAEAATAATSPTDGEG